jgi:hypothetical protein
MSASASSGLAPRSPETSLFLLDESHRHIELSGTSHNELRAIALTSHRPRRMLFNWENHFQIKNMFLSAVRLDLRLYPEMIL